LALTRKSRITIKMKARPFLKESRALLNNINAWVTGQIVTRFNNANR
jgi:hypothetical protein